MSRICVTAISSSLPCAVLCDNLFLGCTDNNILTTAVTKGAHLFTFMPLGPAPALAQSIYLDAVSPHAAPQGITVKLISENEMNIDVCFTVFTKKIPHIIKKLEANGYEFAIYYDAGVNVSILDGAACVYAARLQDDYALTDMLHANGFVYIRVDNCVYRFTDEAPFEYTAFENADMSEKGVAIALPHSGIIYIDDNDAKTEGIDSKNAAVTLACAIKHNAFNLADKLLSPTLAAELCAQDIKEFLGDFATIEVEMCSQNVLYLGYELNAGVFDIRKFEVELAGSKIANITESS